MMDLLLWRHAEAEDSWPDSERKLTKRGETQARQVAEWIRKHVSGDLRIISSPALRCQQTAQMIGQPVETDERLGADSDVTRLLTATGWLGDGEAPNVANATNLTVIAVGHQPLLGQTAARLLSGQESAWPVGKGAVWWFRGGSRKNGAQMALKAVVSTDFV